MTQDVLIRPATAEGTVRVPGSKSVTHRTYVLAAQSDEPVDIAHPLRAADPDATLGALHALGARIEPGETHVTFQPAPLRPATAPLDLRNAGTGLRLLTALAATQPFPTHLTGDRSLRRRPNGPLLHALHSLGARIDDARDGRCPYQVQGPIRPGTVTLEGAVSSQFASALLLVLPMLVGDSRLILHAPVRSRPYIDVTLHAMHAFGLRTTHDDAVFDIPGAQVPRCTRFDVPADWSAAAFPLVAAAVTGGDVTVQGPRQDDAQGDRRIVELLRAFGCRVEPSTDSVRVRGGDLVSPGEVDVAATPDLFPALCVLAACAEGTTTFTGGQSLREKETDRIHAMAEGLERMGITTDERPDGLVVTGGRLQGAAVHAHDDHRIHMAFAVAGLAAQGETRIDGLGCEAVSYPRFHEDLRRLGGAS